jgi:hypothetical protein
MMANGAFGGSGSSNGQGTMLPPQGGDTTNAFQRAGSVSISDAGTDASDAESSSGRPTFKRLPSRTLEPENAKRAALMRRMSYEAEDALSSSGGSMAASQSPVLHHSRPSSSHSTAPAGYATVSDHRHHHHHPALPSSASTIKTEFDDSFYRSPSNSSSGGQQGTYGNSNNSSGKIHPLWGVPPGPMQPPSNGYGGSGHSDAVAARQRRLSAPESPPHHMQRFAMNTSMPPVS